MKKTIIMLVLGMTSFTIDAQVAKDFKMKQMDKSVPLQPVAVNLEKTVKNPTLEVVLLAAPVPEKKVALIYTNPVITTPIANGANSITAKLVANVQNWGDNTIIKPNPVGSAVTTNEGNFTCTSTTETFSSQSTSFMNASQDKVNQFYPGNIANYYDFYTGSHSVNVPARNSITLVSSNLANTSGNVSEVVTSPTMSTVQQAISNIVRRFSTTTGSAGLEYRVFSSTSEADLAIKLNAAGSYAGFKASADYNKTEASKHYYLTFDVIKPMYTINVQPQAGTAAGYLTDPNTTAPDLILINSVTYGTRILANLDIEINNNQDMLDIIASYGQAIEGGVSANAGFNYLKNLNTTTKTLNGYVVGGPMATTVLHLETLEADIFSTLAACNYQSAAPISYTISNLADNKLGIESATDNVIVKKCVPKDAIVSLTGVNVTIFTGSDNKETGSVFNCEVYNRNVNDDGTLAFTIDPSQTNLEYANNTQAIISLQKCATANDEDLLRPSFKTRGGKLRIYFRPKAMGFGFDEWKIKTVKVDFIFTDQYSKTYFEQMNYDCKDAKVGRDSRALECWFDADFKPGSAFITQ